MRVGELATAFNIMSDEIENRINIINIEKNKLNMVLESMGEGVIAFNENNEIIAVNSTAKSILKDSCHEEFNNVIGKVKKISERTVIETEMGGKYILICATPLSLSAGSKGVVIYIERRDGAASSAGKAEAICDQCFA
jgi:signal transduction histidine kinase